MVKKTPPPGCGRGCRDGTWFAAVPISLGMRGSEGYGQEVLVEMSGRQPRKAK